MDKEQLEKQFEKQYDDIRHLLGKHVRIQAISTLGFKEVTGVVTDFVSYEENKEAGYKAGVFVKLDDIDEEWYTTVAKAKEAVLL